MPPQYFSGYTHESNSGGADPLGFMQLVTHPLMFLRGKLWTQMLILSRVQQSKHQMELFILALVVLYITAWY